MHENALAAVLFRADRYGLSLAHLARLRRHQVARAVAHDHAIHARETRAGPGAGGFDVGGQVGGRKEPVGQDPVGGRGLEARIGRSRERGRPKVGWPVLEPGTGGHRGRNLSAKDVTRKASRNDVAVRRQRSPVTILRDAFHNNETGSRSTIRPRARAPNARTTRPIARASAALTSTCQRHRPLSRSIGHGAGPSTLSAPLSRSVLDRTSHAATRSAACWARPASSCEATNLASPRCGGYAGLGGARSGSSAAAKSATECSAAAVMA